MPGQWEIYIRTSVLIISPYKSTKTGCIQVTSRQLPVVDENMRDRKENIRNIEHKMHYMWTYAGYQHEKKLYPVRNTSFDRSMPISLPGKADRRTLA